MYISLSFFDILFGFNGKELDSEGMGGGGSTYDYGFRIYNPSLGRFLSEDPLTKSYPWYTPYQYAGNKPIVFLDRDGLEEIHYTFIKKEDGYKLQLDGIKKTYLPWYKKLILSTEEIPIPVGEKWYIVRFENRSYELETMDEVLYALQKVNPGDEWLHKKGGGVAVSNEHIDDCKVMAAENFCYTMQSVSGASGRSIKPSSTYKPSSPPAVARANTSIGAIAAPRPAAKATTVSPAPSFQASTVGKTIITSSTIQSTGVTIGLGVDDDLYNHRGTGAIIYKNGGWQNAGLTKVDWGKASMDNFSFKESFREAAQKATSIRFDVTSFNPNNQKQGMTNYEFNHIVNDKSLLQKTIFVNNGKEVKWNGKTFE